MCIEDPSEVGADDYAYYLPSVDKFAFGIVLTEKRKIPKVLNTLTMSSRILNFIRVIFCRLSNKRTKLAKCF